MMLMRSLEAFFLKGMAQTWAGGNEGVADPIVGAAVPGRPGYMQLTFTEKKMLLVDRFCVNKDSELFAGTTTIFVAGQPVWAMHYMGITPEVVLPFLRLALNESYSKGKFVGGRGPRRCNHPDHPFEYENGAVRGDFDDFSGKEEIRYNGEPGEYAGLKPEISSNQVVAWTKYFGMHLMRRSQ